MNFFIWIILYKTRIFCRCNRIINRKNNLINIEYYFRYGLIIKYLHTNLHNSKALFLSDKNKTS
jgi:hypothetical protein